MTLDNQIYVCTICNISANTEHQLEEHIKGFRHHNNHKKFIIGNNFNASKECDLRVYAMTFVVVFITTYAFCYVIIKFTMCSTMNNVNTT